MRCDDCRDNPLGQHDYCECCGRRLSAKDEKAVETAPPAVRCESCGGPAEDADLCAACQQAFLSVMETKKREAPAENPIAAVPEVARVEASPSPVVPPPSASPDAPSAPLPAVAALPPPAHRPAARCVPSAPSVAAAPLPPPARPAVDIAPPPTITVRERAPVREQTRSMPRPRPVPPAVRPNAPVPPSPSRGRTRSLFVAAALILIALAVCVPMGQPWLAGEEPSPTPREEQPEEVADQAAIAQSVPASPDGNETSTPPDDTTPDLPEPVRQPKPARREASVAAPPPAVEAFTETTLPAAEPVALAAPSPEPAAAPVGPFFEVAKVNEAPQVASRVEPRVPDDLPGPLNEVVVLRVLVSQTGHVSLVSVLRRSKAGVALDDAVVAAVKQWTFSPARKRGEAVSCWYHVGVPVTRGD